MLNRNLEGFYLLAADSCFRGGWSVTRTVNHLTYPKDQDDLLDVGSPWADGVTTSILLATSTNIGNDLPGMSEDEIDAVHSKIMAHALVYSNSGIIGASVKGPNATVHLLDDQHAGVKAIKIRDDLFTELPMLVVFLRRSWITYQGKHYSVERPLGVVDLCELPVFVRAARGLVVEGYMIEGTKGSYELPRA